MGAFTVSTARCSARPQRMLTVANVVSKTAVGKAGKRGYRFDPGMNRWLQDDRMAGKENVTVVQPKTGIAYTVCPPLPCAS